MCTHLHSDHISDLFVLRYALEMKGMRLPIYLPPPTQRKSLTSFRTVLVLKSHP
ncbi:hypothetical protein [Eubacterium aggregans]|uniref:hypothetical protein n=1 Tax=Eubacterium aggregans TaxID=81409 RepID=UPI003F2AD4E1